MKVPDICNMHHRVCTNEVMSRLDVSEEKRSNEEGPINWITDTDFQSILLLAREAFFAIACVNKKWNEIAYSAAFYGTIYKAVNPIDGKDWVDLGFGKPDKEPPIPFKWLLKFRIGKDRPITLIPEKVTKDGEELSITMRTIGEMWAKKMNIVGQQRPGYTDDSWKEVIDEVRPTEETHWIWLKGAYTMKRQCDPISHVTMSGGSMTLPTCVMMFVAHAKTGKNHFEWNPRSYRMITVKDLDMTNEEMREHFDDDLEFRKPGLYLAANGISIYNLEHFEYPDPFSVAAYVARKSILNPREVKDIKDLEDWVP